MKRKRIMAAHDWLLKSIEVCEGNGSAAFYHPIKGWSKAYPETTGYIIPTLLELYKKTKENIFLEYAISCSDWLLTLQLKNGSFPGGVGGKEAPNVFDTGQIIFGLTAIYEFTEEKKYLNALKKAVIHLLEILESDGSWKKEAYIQNYIPSYYTRVIWAVLQADKYLKISDLKSKMKLALIFYLKRINSNCTIQNWAFNSKEKALTHTIAYTIRGFLESSLILEDEKMLAIAERIAEKLLEVVQANEKLAGSYDENWEGDYHFICVPGHFQMSIVFYRLYEITQKELYLKWAFKLFKEGEKAQIMIPFKNIYGGFSGSYPVWGEYQRFKLLNWSMKFYLEADLKFN